MTWLDKMGKLKPGGATSSRRSPRPRLSSLPALRSAWANLFPGRQPRVTSRFGPRFHPITGSAHPHDGIDLALSPGERAPIHAPFDGFVAWKATDKSGLTMTLTDGDVRVVVRHMSAAKAEGSVSAGDELGNIGDSGKTTGVHAHVELQIRRRRAWVPVDPTPYITDVEVG